MINPKLMSDGQLIQCLAVKVTALRSSISDLIDSSYEDRISREFYGLKMETLNRMGKSSNAHNIALLDELAEIAIKVIDPPYKKSGEGARDRYFQIKERVLLIMAENSSHNTIIATATQS